MKVNSIIIQNFRKLLECRIDISEGTTLFVGANNSGKTSAMDALAKFLANRSFVFNDITISRRTDINKIGSRWAELDCQQPNDLLDWDSIVPKMDIWLDIASNEKDNSITRTTRLFYVACTRAQKSLALIAYLGQYQHLVGYRSHYACPLPAATHNLEML